jgi:hypothetical protein
MSPRASRAFFVIFMVVVAPVGAAVLITAVLLAGAPARLVFAPGHALMAVLDARGVHPPNAVGVVSTVALWWLAIVALGAAWEWRSGRRAGAGR